MRKVMIWSALAAGATGLLSGCGDNGSDNNGTQQPLISYVGTTDAFAAWLDGATGSFAVAPTGAYAGKRQLLRGTVDPITGVNVGQLSGVEIYKYNDGHIYALDLTSADKPVGQQISSESAATIDDTCSLTGNPDLTGSPQVAGANSDYLGVNQIQDTSNPTNTRYFYRLPGPDGVCNTADDIIRMVTPATPAGAAPVTVPAMPTAGVRTAAGAITGFVVKSGASLVLYDSNFANPVVLGTFSAPIGVATPLPSGLTQGVASGLLYIVDGNIVYVNYASPGVSPTLFTLPSWTPTLSRTPLAASPTTLYFATNIPPAGATPSSTSVYSMPADGSAAPSLIATYPGFVQEMQFPVNSSNLVYAVSSNGVYTVYALAQGSATPAPILISTQNLGSFTATATSVYYSTWSQVTNTTALTVTRSGTQSGIVGVDGSVIMPPVANSMFATGGEYAPWPLTIVGGVVSQTALQTVFQVQNLSPVSVSSSATGYTYSVDGVAGGTVIPIDTGTNQALAAVGTVRSGSAMFLAATFRSPDHSGYMEASTYTSTQDPATEDLYVVNSHMANTLQAATRNL
jgi:hypothetical protein